MSGFGGERFHALDAVRGWALILGVFFHATLSFLPGPPLWVTMDPSRSTELAVLFYVLHIFRMTVFFVLAGFFARLALERRGSLGFIRNRAVRIAAPLALFWPASIAAVVVVAIWAAVQASGGAMPEGPPPPPITAETFPLTHLWFLYLLLFFYAGALVLRGVLRLIDRRGAMGERIVDPLMRTLGGPAAPLWLAIPVAATLYLTPQWYSWFGIPTPDRGLMPNLSALLIYGLAFGFGWLLNRQPEILQRWGAYWLAYVGPAIGATVTCLVIGGVAPSLEPAQQNLTTLGYAALYAFAGWAWTFAIVGFAVRHLTGESPARRYLADASYWLYLVHLPIVMALQTALAPYSWPWFAKYPLIVGVAFAIMLASYQLFVRYSFVGAILNGRRTRLSKAQRGPQLVAAE